MLSLKSLKNNTIFLSDDLLQEVMKTLIIVGGLSGVGKSYAARMLHNMLENTNYFDSDLFAKQFIESQGIEFVGLSLPEQTQIRLGIHQAKIDKLIKDFDQFNTIILDTCFDLAESRKLFYEFSHSYGIKMHVIEIVCPEQEVKKKIFNNPHEEHRMIGDKESRWKMYLQMKKKWQHITRPHTIIESDDDVKTQLTSFIKAKLS